MNALEQQVAAEQDAHDAAEIERRRENVEDTDPERELESEIGERPDDAEPGEQAAGRALAEVGAVEARLADAERERDLALENVRVREIAKWARAAVSGREAPCEHDWVTEHGSSTQWCVTCGAGREAPGQPFEGNDRAMPRGDAQLAFIEVVRDLGRGHLAAGDDPDDVLDRCLDDLIAYTLAHDYGGSAAHEGKRP